MVKSPTATVFLLQAHFNGMQQMETYVQNFLDKDEAKRHGWTWLRDRGLPDGHGWFYRRGTSGLPSSWLIVKALPLDPVTLSGGVISAVIVRCPL